MSNTLNAAKYELELYKKINNITDDKIKSILDVINTFIDQHHSGMSAAITTGIFKRLVLENKDEAPCELKDHEIYDGMLYDAVQELLNKFYENYLVKEDLDLIIPLLEQKQLTPLTFEDSEWVNITESGYSEDEINKAEFQNKRNSAVFKKGKDGKPYYIYAYYMINKETKSTWHGSIKFDDGTRIGKCFIIDPSKMPSIGIEIPIVKNTDNDDWEFLPISKDHPKIKELKKYYELEFIKNE